MKSFPQMLSDQLVGALLTGSVARGDARISPWGLYIDVTLVLKDDGEIDLEKVFGKNEEPDIPKHCVNLFDKVGMAHTAASSREEF